MSRLRINNISGTITDNPLTSGATTFNAAALSAFPVVAAPDYAAVVFEPDTANEEIAYIMAHTAAATSATLWRNRESSTAVAHASGTTWRHGPTARDFLQGGKPSVPGIVWAPSDWDSHWVQAAYGVATGAAPAKVLHIGGSVSIGQLSSNNMTKGYDVLTRANVLAMGALGGDYIDVKYSNAWSTMAGSAPWTLGTTFAWNFGGFNVYPSWSSAPNPFLTFTGIAAGVALDVIWMDGGGAGTVSWDIDGTGQTALTTTGTKLIKRTSITGLPNSIHTVHFTAQSGANLARILGICTYPTSISTAGFQWGMAGYPGAHGHDLGRVDAASPDDKVARLLMGNTASAEPFNTGFGFPTQPDLLILGELAEMLDLGWNTAVNLPRWGYGPSGFFDLQRRICEAARRGNPNCSILMVLPQFPDSTYSDNNTLNMDGYNAKLAKLTYFQIAQEFNCAIVDMDDKWGATPVAQGFLVLGNIDPTDAGHQDFANVVKQLVVI